jgi:hypothetical protein
MTGNVPADDKLLSFVDYGRITLGKLGLGDFLFDGYYR